MKKRIFCLSLAVLLLISCACSKSPKKELYNYEVTDEPFESMEISYTHATYLTHENEQELYDKADLVFIGMPVDTFTDGKARYFDRDLNEVTENSEDILYRYTTRDIKVLEMIKGDSSLETVRVADRAAVKTYEDGSTKILGLPNNTHIAKKNVKYVYYVYHALGEQMDFYFTAYDGGLVNLDGLDEKVDLGNHKLADTKARFSRQFIKYDRSAELETK
ncbi:MAG: hypothetical protein IJ408_02295 [Clostridia bacterium]|nr:hypothetical protein [Clostridia bacterium]